jgi:hypothetical protein
LKFGLNPRHISSTAATCERNLSLQAAKKAGMQCTKEALAEGLQQLEDLIPGFVVDLEVMKASQWVSDHITN